MSKFCVDCKHSSGSVNLLECELTRKHHVNQVTGKPWSDARYCSNVQKTWRECPTFEKKPTTWERIKGVFNVL